MAIRRSDVFPETIVHIVLAGRKKIPPAEAGIWKERQYAEVDRLKKEKNLVELVCGVWDTYLRVTLSRRYFIFLGPKTAENVD